MAKIKTKYGKRESTVKGQYNFLPGLSLGFGDKVSIGETKRKTRKWWKPPLFK